MSRTRRAALRALGACVGLGSLAGCLSPPDEDGNGAGATTESTRTTETTGPSATTQPSTVGPSAFRFEATTVAGFTSAHPARVRLELTNVAERPVRVLGGPTLPFGPARASTTADDGDDLYLVPLGSDDVFLREWTADAPGADGCWDVEGNVVWHSIAHVKTLDTGASLATEVSLFDATDDRVCLPAGTYVAADGLEAGPEGNTSWLALRVEVTLSATQEVAVATSLGVE